MRLDGLRSVYAVSFCGGEPWCVQQQCGVTRTRRDWASRVRSSSYHYRTRMLWGAWMHDDISDDEILNAVYGRAFRREPRGAAARAILEAKRIRAERHPANVTTRITRILDV